MKILRHHYPEYLMEAAGLGILMVMASLLTALLEHPTSPWHHMIAAPLLRRFCIGVGMGLTVISLIYSPWGQQSGAHFNPVVTLTFLRLGKITPLDAFYYVVAQFAGGLVGISVAGILLGEIIKAPTVHYIVTTPGVSGDLVAFCAELAISFGLMLTILVVSNHAQLSRFTGVIAGVLIAIYITIEAPFSGMSMNPARTLASAIPAQTWTAIWIYFTAPLCGMFVAATLYAKSKGLRSVRCAKLHHHNNKRCIFNCSYRQEDPFAKLQ